MVHQVGPVVGAEAVHEQRAVGVHAALGPHRLLELPDDDRLGVVDQVLPHARQVGHDVDPESLEVLARPDAGVLQQARRVDRAGRDDDLLAGRDAIAGAGVAQHLDRRRAAAGGLDAHRAATRSAPTGSARQRAVQVHDRRRRAHARGGVVSDVEEPGPVTVRARVPVRVRLHPEGRAARVDPVEQDRVAVGLGDQPVRAGDAVVVRVHLVVRPALAPLGDPVVPVVRKRLEPDHRVVRGAPAEHLRARVDDVRVPARLQRRGVREVERSLEQAEPAPDLEHVVVADIARAPLQHADRRVRILAEACRDDGACASAPHDHVVELVGHGRSLSQITSRLRGAPRSSPRECWCSPRGTTGMIAQSATYPPSSPCRRRRGSTTAAESVAGPILQVPTGW